MKVVNQKKLDQALELLKSVHLQDENGDIVDEEIINLNEFLKEQYNEENYLISYK